MIKKQNRRRRRSRRIAPEGQYLTLASGLLGPTNLNFLSQTLESICTLACTCTYNTPMHTHTYMFHTLGTGRTHKRKEAPGCYLACRTPPGNDGCLTGRPLARVIKDTKTLGPPGSRAINNSILWNIPTKPFERGILTTGLSDV